ncbi:tRNA (adenosine(37)-N6)-dimethylallyltransferase MiaA [Blattabacterium cuenoti]|uniref:tRNA (adenosine(37)-N6)-dimethylallyltransferase MiaA n=1 Tax=Blattabacterium cuenoti TaxID=1653831 RepID=UPI0021D1EEF7|nr:tRNA (adenosine(37)-N6)-dimethylallyltransferase MiaA [Blattabacterium cuenoti]
MSLFLAKRLKTEILSCDSRQFYKELKIGSYRPTIKELQSVPHHFIGHLTIHQSYNAKRFEKDSLKKMKQLFKKYSILIMVGGSGLYEKSITEGLSDIPNIDLNIRNNLIYHFKKEGIFFLQKEIQKLSPIPTNIDMNNPRRLIRYLEIVRSTGKNPSFFFQKKNLRFFSTLKIGLTLPREEIYIRINNRVEKMIQMGLLEEASRHYSYRYLNSLDTIGYKEIYDFLSKKKNLSMKQ